MIRVMEMQTKIPVFFSVTFRGNRVVNQFKDRYMKSGRIIRRTFVTGFFFFSGSRNFLKDSRNRAIYLFNASFAKMCSVLLHDRLTVFL